MKKALSVSLKAFYSRQKVSNIELDLVKDLIEIVDVLNKMPSHLNDQNHQAL
jgi:hypothetical protein